jgi:hypothetical protein
MSRSNEWQTQVPVEGLAEGTMIQVLVTEELVRTAKVFIGHDIGHEPGNCEEPHPCLCVVYENGQWAEFEDGLKWRFA